MLAPKTTFVSSRYTGHREISRIPPFSFMAWKALVHKFITSGSVEERIDRMIQEKSKLAADIVGSGEDWLGGLDVGQLKDLVALSSEEDA